MKYDKGTIVAEIAGRDSIAALIKHAKENPKSYFLPTIAMIPPEEDRYEDTLSYIHDLQRYVFNIGSFLYDPLFLDGEYAWWMVNKPAHELMDKYGFFTYCLGCHGVVHAIRVPFAKELSGRIITGERLRHGEKVKVNQCPIVIDSYGEFFASHGIEHIAPILHIEHKSEIDDIMREFEEEYLIHDFRPIECNLSGNGDGLDSSTLSLKKYMDDYLLNALDEIVAEEEKGWM